MKRYDISNGVLLKNGEDISLTSVSLNGLYYIPEIGENGFYKENGIIIDAKEDADLRELLATRIMDRIDYPHANVMLTKGNNNKHGCVSINILKPSEHFVELPSDNLENVYYTEPSSVDEFIERDFREIELIPGITSEDLRTRKDYLLKYLFVSALISNTDVKSDNRCMIKDESTGRFRNPEYYDMGVAFVENDHRYFLVGSTSEQLIEELYKSYPSQIVPFGQKVSSNLSIDTIQTIMSEDCFQDFSPQVRQSIIERMDSKIKTIRECNYKHKNDFLYGIEDIHEMTGTSVQAQTVFGQVRYFLKSKLENLIRRDRSDGVK